MAAALAAAVTLPAAASTGTTNGGTSATPPAGGQSPEVLTADYESVTASWYGPGLYGKETACGATLTHHTLGVAHRRLPCGTKVALRYQGRTIVVPVIDRGPYSRGISYDLTYATARKLGIRSTSQVGAARLDG